MGGSDRVVFRLVLGLAQMVGAVIGVCSLLQTGMSGPDV